MQEYHDLSVTATLPHIGIEEEKIPKTDPLKIKENDAAFSMLLNTLKTSSDAYEEAQIKIKMLENENRILDKKSSERKNSVIILSIAEIITSIGIGGLFTSIPWPFAFVLSAGIIMTILSLYLNFKK